MKINVFNRDRKGGHKLSPLMDSLGTIYSPSPTVRKIAKQITGRKARREHAKAIERELELWAADCEKYGGFWDSINEDDLNTQGEDNPYDDPYYDFYQDDYDYDYYDSFHSGHDWKKGVVTDQWGNLVARFESYFQASEYVTQNPHFTLHEC